jgi:hypothetical protein
MKRPGLSSLAVFAAAACLLSAAEAHATASTHIWAPSTDIQAFGVWHVTADIYAAEGAAEGGVRLPAVTNYGLTVGVLPFERAGLEVGLDHKSGLGALDAYPMYGNAKLGVPESAFGKHSPALAVGVFDVGTESGLTDYNVVYGKLAKTLQAGRVSLGRLSAGYFLGSEDLLLNGSGEKDNAGLLAAWERTVTELSDKLWLCVEYMGTESAYGCLNVGGAWKVADNVSVLGGYDIFNNEDLVNTVTVQVDIDI